MRWANTCEVVLRSIFVDPDVIGGLLTRRYWQLASQSITHMKAMVIGAEMSHQGERLTALADAMKEFLVLRDPPGDLVMLDTNIMLHHQRIDKVPWREVIGSRETVRIVIPLVVLDELDNKKYLGSPKLIDRARGAFMPLDERQDEIERDGRAVLRDGVTVEYLRDPPDHQRLTNPDAETIDRAVFLRRVTGRRVVVVTGDRGMRVRLTARPDDLRAVTMPFRFAQDQT